MDVTAARRSFLCDIGFWADRTALHEAASHGRALQLKQLIESGASVNVVTVDNITPLHEACIQAHPNCARLLLEAGAQIFRQTLLRSAVEERLAKRDYTYSNTKDNQAVTRNSSCSSAGCETRPQQQLKPIQVPPESQI